MTYYSEENVQKIKDKGKTITKKGVQWNEKYHFFLPIFIESAPDNYKTNNTFIFETKMLLGELKMAVKMTVLFNQLK